MSSSGGQSVEGRGTRSWTRSGLGAAASPVAVVLILAGIFHFYRGVPGEGVLFVAVALAIAAELSGGFVSEFSTELKSELPESSGLSGVAGVERSQPAPGGIPGDSLDDGSQTAERYHRTTLVWCCFGIAVCLVELAVYLLSDPPLREFEYPTLSTLLEPIVAVPIGRLAAAGVDRPRIGLVAVVAGWDRPFGGAQRGRVAMISRVVVISVFVAFGLAAVAIDSKAHRPGSRLVPVAVLLQSAMGQRTVRIAVLLVWWWLGWHFLVEP